MKTTKQRLVHLAIVAVVTTTAYASAASLGGLASDTLGAGSAVVASCDEDGLAISYNVVDDNVTGIVVDGLAPTCAGGRLFVTLADDSGSALGSGTHASITATSEMVAIAPEPAAAAVTQAHIVILGP